jgi:hypothetical protein
MSRRKSGAERRAIRNRNKRARSGAVVGEGCPGLPRVGDENPNTERSGSVDQVSLHQSDTPNELQQLESPWWRELSPENIAKANAMGMGGAVKSMMDRRLELQAVSENWPISREVRERIVYESIMVLLDPKADPRLKQRERWMLHKMSEANNRPKDLPVQVNTGTTITVNQILAMIEGGKVASQDDLDLRDIKVLPGAPDDYA